MNKARWSRQSFLGPNSANTIDSARVGIIGLGGGGSHIALQLAHIGFRRYALADPDVTEESNLNRNVVATSKDAKSKAPKTEVAARAIRALIPDAEIMEAPARWQDCAEPFKGCDLLFGCVDSFSERNQLEAFSRRFIVPYIDIGMDVNPSPGSSPIIGGQVILSLPGGPCMHCLGFLSEEKLAAEASRYGVAGPRPQVVWPNGVLASTAVGIGIDVLTGWTGTRKEVIYLSYVGNTGIIQPHIRLDFMPRETCPHYPASEVGDPKFKSL